MNIVRSALNRPYTVAAAVLLVCLLGVLATSRMPVDIFPEIDIPVVSVVWTYGGMSADDIQNRILVNHERQMASLVDDISRIEANSYTGVGVIKVYLHEGADVSRAVSQLASSAQAIFKYLPRNITPPLIIRYGATDVPIIQLSLSSRVLPDQRLTDFGQQVLRPALAVVHGASVPYPYGGKPRVVMVDLDTDALQARAISPADVTAALQVQNLVSPCGDVKIGSLDYAVRLNNSADAIDDLNSFPVKQMGGVTVFLRDVAHVHDGAQVQTNAVDTNGLPSSLMMIRKTGRTSSLAVIDGVKQLLPELRLRVPEGVTIEPLFDQSVFIKGALDSVVMSGLMAAGLTAIMILLFLGNWRLTVIILMSIPLSVVAALLVMYVGGQTLNTMTLGGFALAVGILVDNATVVIENIERNLALGVELEAAIEQGSAEILIPTLVSTLAVCVVFVPVFLLEGTAKYLFSPLSLSVIISLLASLILSFTLVPVMFKFLMRSYLTKHGNRPGAHDMQSRRTRNPLLAMHLAFDGLFHLFRRGYRACLTVAVRRPLVTSCAFLILLGASTLLFPRLGLDFFPQVDAGLMRLHVRAPAGTRMEETRTLFAGVEREIRHLVGDGEVDVVLDNVGLPYSGINIAVSDTATVGPMDGEILISLREGHRPTTDHMAALRTALPRAFPQMQFFFQPADIVNQVLNFGQPAPIDVQITGPDAAADYATARRILADLRRVPGLVDAHIFQVPDGPALRVDVERTVADEMGMAQRDVADNVLISLSSSATVSPNFWLSPDNQVSYPVVVQTPGYRVDSIADLAAMPLTSKMGDQHPMLMSVADVSRGRLPLLLSQLNIRPVFDIHADVQGTDLGTVAAAIDEVVRADTPAVTTGIHVSVAGQIVVMRESFFGLAAGIGLAVVLVFLLMVANFQSWVDPLIVLAAVPCALAGVMWMLFATHTHISVPALMGTLMCVGLTTANSILVVSFANQRMLAGDDAATAAVAAGYTRLRPVLMTAGAMILGMVPMALGIGEGGEQNAPLGRAVVGGLVFATVATLVLVPAVYGLLRRRGDVPPRPIDAT